MSRWFHVIFLVVLIVELGFSNPGITFAQSSVKLGFDSNWKKTWRPVTFPDRDKTTYRYFQDGKALCAEADASASGFIRDFPEKDTFPHILSWQWKVKSTVPGGNARKKSGDDYAARLYVNFEIEQSMSYWEQFKLGTYETLYGQDIPSRSMNFIWANKVKKGTVIPSPYTDRTRLVVLRDQSDTVDEWVTETINLGNRYETIFEASYIEPHSIAVMTDSDNTKTQVEGCYRNIILK